MEEDEDEEYDRLACRFCEFYGYDECPIGGCVSEDDEDEE